MSSSFYVVFLVFSMVAPLKPRFRACPGGDGSETIGDDDFDEFYGPRTSDRCDEPNRAE